MGRTRCGVRVQKSRYEIRDTGRVQEITNLASRITQLGSRITQLTSNVRRTMKLQILFLPLAVLSLSIASISAAQAQPAESPDADKILRGMCDYLNSLKQFSYQAEVSYDAPESDGQSVQYDFDMVTYVRRPDRLRVDAEGDGIDKQFFFNGRTITLYDRKVKMYAAMDVPPDIEGALEKAHNDFDLRVALTDLASPKLCDHLVEAREGTRVLGLSKVRGIATHHLVLDRKDIRVQVWIETGEKPLPRKVLITDKNLPGSQEWIAYLNHWNTASKMNETLFTFVAPKGAQRIQFLPVKDAGTSGKSETPAAKGDMK